MKYTYILLFFFTVLQYTFGQDYLDEGLFFSAAEVNPDQRTSLNLSPNKPLHFNNKLSLEFEANFRKNKNRSYGNIFKIVGDKEINIELVGNLVDEGDNFWLSVGNTKLFKYKWSDIPKAAFNKWIKFKLELNGENSTISTTINGDKIEKKTEVLNGLKNLDIIFGKSQFKNLSNSDVCPMSIKNIIILNKENKPIKYWSLGKHTTNDKVYDNLSNSVAFVENPNWLIDQHMSWSKENDLKFNNLLGSAKDIEGNRIFFIDSVAVYIYNLESKVIDTLNYTPKTTNFESVDFVYNDLKGELAAYSIEKQTYNTFDFENSEWLNPIDARQETVYLHHSKIISPKDSTLITFGGYGHYTYKSLLKQFSSSPSIQLLNYETSSYIAPRYLSSTGILNSDEFLVFGGYGSPTGVQGVNGQFYYDLNVVNFVGFDSLKVRKIWELKNPDNSPFVPVQSMVVDQNSDSFYTLTYNNTIYNTKLKLTQFGINEQNITVFPDSIPYKFLDIKSNADFFLDTNKTKLYTLTTIENKASVYSLTYPPLFAEDVYQKEIETHTTSYRYLWYFLILAALIVAVLFLYKRKKSYELVVEKQPINEEVLELSHSKLERHTTSSIYLFGGFQVYDKNGTDITGLFTPTLKQLFLVILLSGIKNEKGISSIRLTELLWPNKSENKARNNRNVNISKLRILLDDIGDIDISNENTYWKMKIGSTVFCDYSFVKNILRDSINHTIEKEQVYKLISIVSSGVISPDLQTDWIEDYRLDIENLLIDDLNRISRNIDDSHLLILIANTILKYGPLNEEAIALKCRSLFALGKKGKAKQSYNQFCKEYFEMLDAKYDKSFKSIIG